jgi:hypothetical protein
MDVTREWLKSATAAKDVSKEESETVMPLLHVRANFLILSLSIQSSFGALKSEWGRS